MGNDHVDDILPSISAEEIHRNNLKHFREGNRAHLELAKGIIALNDPEFLGLLGFTSIYQYALVYFGYHRTATDDCFRVVQALEALPASSERYRLGSIYWSAIVEITKIASRETEVEWLAFAAGQSVRKIRAEVEDAMENGRKTPQKRKLGLPNLRVTIPFRLTYAEHGLLEKAFSKVAKEMREGMGGKGRIEPKDILLFMARRFLETDLPGTPKGRIEKEDPISTLLYHVCPDCRKAHFMTREGPVEVGEETIQRVEGEARKVTIAPEEELPGHGTPDRCDRPIDRPNPPILTRKVVLRDGLRCINPHCPNSTGLQSNHVELRSEGGRTELANSCSLCPRCHALYHASLINLSRGPEGELIVTRRGDVIRREVEEETRAVGEKTKLDGLSTQADLTAQAAPGARSTFGRPNDGRILPRFPSEKRFPGVVKALRKLRWSKDEAEERVREAVEKLARAGKSDADEQEVLHAALSGRIASPEAGGNRGSDTGKKGKTGKSGPNPAA